MDRFMEMAVQKRNRTLDEILYYVSLVMMIVFAVFAFFNLQMMLMGFDVTLLISFVLFGGMAAYLFFTNDRHRTEYEYTFTNGDLEFAMVFNNKKRKNLGKLNVAKVDAFGRVESGSFHRHSNTPGIKHLRWFLNREADLHYFVFSKDGQKSLLVFEPNEELVGYIKHYLPYGAHQEN